MSFLRNLEQDLFFYGFQKCSKKENLNFLKINETDYLLIKIFRHNTADLIHAKFHPDSNPCLSEPIWEKTIKLGYSPGEDNHILKSYTDNLKIE
ncbi:MAG TPA: hypothetical protein VGK10_01065 [Prolixibacteraceae bacterium]|jgi:hypothetical protein